MEVPTKSFKIDETSLSENEKLANELDYLLSLNDAKVIIDDKLAYEAFFYWAKCTLYINQEIIDIVLKKKGKILRNNI